MLQLLLRNASSIKENDDEANRYYKMYPRFKGGGPPGPMNSRTAWNSVLPNVT